MTTDKVGLGVGSLFVIFRFLCHDNWLMQENNIIKKTKRNQKIPLVEDLMSDLQSVLQSGPGLVNLEYTSYLIFDS